MPKNSCLDLLLIISLASFVSITLPITSLVISDYKSTRSYVDGICNGTTITNYTVSGGFFYHGHVNLLATVNGKEYTGFLYYPPIKHWQFGFMPKMEVDEWYYSLNKTGTFECFIDLSDNQHPMINQWIEITGYYTMFVMCLIIVTGWIIIVCTIHNSKQRRRRYISIPDDLPPPYTQPSQSRANHTQSLYKSLNDELTTISV